MTHGGIRQLSDGSGLIYTRRPVQQARPAGVGRPVNDPIQVDVSVRSTAVGDLYHRHQPYPAATGRLLDCYI